MTKSGKAIKLLGLILGLLAAPGLAQARTFYVDASTGNDNRTTTQAQDPSTPWLTIRRAMSTAIGGDTVLVKPGVYMETVGSKRDATATAPIVVRSTVVKGAIVQPTAGAHGFVITHNYHTIDGFLVWQASTGMKLGPNANSTPVVGLLIQNNTVDGSTFNGINVVNGLTTEIAFNTVRNNGQNGISYSGNSSHIHGNVANSNAQFGIYVKDGVDHQVYENQASGNGQANIKINGSTIPPPGAGQRTFYVDCQNGNDSYTQSQAQAAATPWRTIRTAMIQMLGGDTVVVLPGVCAESVKSRTDGTAASVITIKAATPGTVTIQPPAGESGFFIEHHHHVIEGFVVTGGLNGLQLGPHQADTSINGLVARDIRAHGNAAVGIKFMDAAGGSVTHSLAYNNGAEGISYGSNRGGAANASIFNNLVYNNGLNQQGKFGMSFGGGGGHRVTNNTLYGNVFGGIMLGNNNTPVFATVMDNVVSNNPTGIKENPSTSYFGRATLDYNNVHGSTTNYSLNPGTGTVVGPNSISAPPVFVDAAANDFRLGRVASGQAADSPCIDRGSDTTSAVGLAGRTAFSDKYPDSGRVDLGYHPTLLYPSMGTLTVNQILMNLNPAGGGDDFYVSLSFQPGTGSDGLAPGVNYSEFALGTLVFPIPVSGFQPQGSQWVYTGASGSVTSATFEMQGESVNVTLQGSGLNLLFNDAPTTLQFTLGDDFGSATVPLRGTLLYP